MMREGVQWGSSGSGYCGTERDNHHGFKELLLCVQASPLFAQAFQNEMIDHCQVRR
jgi:hypothetical protein